MMKGNGGFGRPVSLTCFICGRDYGTKSLKIHIPQCEKKWINEQQLKPPRDRRPLPNKPKGLDQLLNMDKITQKDIQNYNSGALQQWNDDVLEKCPNCGRTFNYDALQRHMKACKGDGSFKPLQKGKGMGGGVVKDQQYGIYAKDQHNDQQFEGGDYENVNLVPCSKCGRKFAADRVQKHQKVCKPNWKPKKNEFNQKKPQKETGGDLKSYGWKEKHQEFANAMKYMRQMKAHEKNGGKISDMPPPPKSINSDYIECQYCGRSFAPKAAERHIPSCANTINKPKGIKGKVPAYQQQQMQQKKPVQQSYNQKPSQPSYNQKPVQQKPQKPVYGSKYNDGKGVGGYAKMSQAAKSGMGGGGGDTSNFTSMGNPMFGQSPFVQQQKGGKGYY